MVLHKARTGTLRHSGFTFSPVLKKVFYQAPWAGKSCHRPARHDSPRGATPVREGIRLGNQRTAIYGAPPAHGTPTAPTPSSGSCTTRKPARLSIITRCYCNAQEHKTKTSEGAMQRGYSYRSSGASPVGVLRLQRGQVVFHISPVYVHS